MFEENLARSRTHRNNIHRYRRLLETRLSGVERDYLIKRLDEETAAGTSSVSLSNSLAAGRTAGSGLNHSFGCQLFAAGACGLKRAQHRKRVTHSLLPPSSVRLEPSFLLRFS